MPARARIVHGARRGANNARRLTRGAALAHAPCKFGTDAVQTCFENAAKSARVRCKRTAHETSHR
eukprot:11214793-Lingulodinium_polyedra.AAC.1